MDFRPFQPSLMFVGEARGLPQSGTPERCFTLVGSGLTCKHQTRLERLSQNKHCSLLRKFVNYARKKFYNIGAWCPQYQQYPKFIQRLVLACSHPIDLQSNGEISSVNIMLDGTMYPSQKLAHFVLSEKTEVNKTHHLIPGISTVILGVTEPP